MEGGRRGFGELGFDAFLDLFLGLKVVVGGMVMNAGGGNSLL